MDLNIFGTFVVLLDCIITISSKEPVVHVHPQNVTVYRGRNIELGCTFKETISRCTWYRNGTAVNIKERYKYQNSDDNGINTTDCTIEIIGFSQIDATRWQCSYTVFDDDNNNKNVTRMSNYGYLSMNPSDPTEDDQTISEVSVHPQNTSVMEGGNVTLRCKFNDAVDVCVWLRNGSVISIKERYRYDNSKVNGNNTRDCSIKISKFSKIDATKWQCLCASTSTIENVNCTTNPAYLTTTTAAITTTDESEESKGGVYLIYFLVGAGIGLLMMAVTLIVTIYCHRKKKAKKKDSLNNATDLKPLNCQPRDNDESLHSYANLDNCGPFLSHDEQKTDSQAEEIFMSIDEIMKKYPRQSDNQDDHYENRFIINGSAGKGKCGKNTNQDGNQVNPSL